MHEGDLVLSMQPEQGPLLAYHLEDLGGAPKLRFASPIGRGGERPRDGLDRRLRAHGGRHRLPRTSTPCLLTCPPAGGSSSCIRSRRGRTTGTRPGPQLVRRRSAQWGAALAADKRFERVAVVPAQLPPRHPDRSARRPLREDRMSEITNTTADRSQIARPELREKPTVILGGGPAGLTAGYLLAKQGLPVIVLEAEDQVGGIAKTAVRDGYRFDLGGHRFFTKAKEVDDLWHEIMKEEFLKRPRMSRIYWRDRHGEAKFLDYPLRGPDVIKKLGPGRPDQGASSPTCGRRSSPRARRRPSSSGSPTASASCLFNQFFKSYTEKVWGVPTSEIRADWAAQRIKGLSFFSAAKSAFFGNRGNKIKSLISEFNYPRYGPGQMWEQMTEDIEDARRPGAARDTRSPSSSSRATAACACTPATRSSSPRP